MWVYVFTVLLAVAANQVGWIAAEVGRQPWIVHPPVVRNDAGEPVFDQAGFLEYETVEVELPDGSSQVRHAGLRTDDGVSKVVEAEQVAASIVMFLFIYALLGSVWLFVLNRKIQAGPEPPAQGFDGEVPLKNLLAVAADPSERRSMIDVEAERGNDTAVSEPEPSTELKPNDKSAPNNEEPT